MIYRDYLPHDCSRLKQMVFALYEEDSEGESITEAKVDATIDKFSNVPGRGKIVIFQKEDNIIGYSLLVFYWSNEYGGEILFIDELYVLPEFRKRGVSTGFIKYLEKEYSESAKIIQLEITPTNENAKRLYSNLGFERCKNTHYLLRNTFG